MKEYKKLTYIFIIFFFISGCKTPKKKKVNENENSIEIIVSCGEDSNLEKYINDGWNIKKEYSEEKICSWKTIAASKDCDLEKDKGCKIVQPDKIGEEKIYLLEKNKLLNLLIC